MRSLRRGSANLGHQAVDRDEQGGPAGICVRREQDVARFEVGGRHVQDDPCPPFDEAYVYMYDIDDPDVIRAFQQYTDTAAASAFLTTPAYAAYVAAVEHLLVGPPSVTHTDVIWMKEQ